MWSEGSKLVSRRHGGGMRVMCGQFLRTLLDFSKCLYNLVYVFFIGQQRGLRNPNCFPSCPLGVRKRLLQECMLFFSLSSTQALAILPIAEHLQLMQWWIACLVRNSLRVHGFDKALGRDPGKLLSV